MTDDWAFIRDKARRNAEARAKQLADAKAAAPAGKEPFDLARLETMCDTSREGQLDPVDARRDKYEYMYYVDFPKLMTLADLAAKVSELGRWS